MPRLKPVGAAGTRSEESGKERVGAERGRRRFAGKL